MWKFFILIKVLDKRMCWKEILCVCVCVCVCVFIFPSIIFWCKNVGQQKVVEVKWGVTALVFGILNQSLSLIHLSVYLSIYLSIYLSKLCCGNHVQVSGQPSIINTVGGLERGRGLQTIPPLTLQASSAGQGRIRVVIMLSWSVLQVHELSPEVFHLPAVWPCSLPLPPHPGSGHPASFTCFSCHLVWFTVWMLLGRSGATHWSACFLRTGKCW